MTNQVLIQLGKKLFQFSSFDNWVDTATAKFKKAGISPSDVVCIDAYGRLCLSGKEFMRARDQKAFPVRVYAVRLDS